MVYAILDIVIEAFAERHSAVPFRSHNRRKNMKPMSHAPPSVSSLSNAQMNLFGLAAIVGAGVIAS